MKHSIITLLTDFGTEDEYVGVMKGVILSINPSAIIVDITHQIAPQGVIEAGYMLKASYPYFPKGAIHVVIVDPGVGTSRRIVAIRKADRLFIAPNNGVLTPLLADGDMEQLVRVDNPDYFLNPISRTFHGRDIFAPVAAHLSNGVPLTAIGPPIKPESLKRLSIPKPIITEQQELIGEIVAIDRFGNLITNVDNQTLEAFNPLPTKKLTIRIKSQTIDGLSESYQSVEAHQPLAIIGSRGYLEIAVNGGNAKRYFKAGKREPIIISRNSD